MCCPSASTRTVDAVSFQSRSWNCAKKISHILGSQTLLDPGGDVCEAGRQEGILDYGLSTHTLCAGSDSVIFQATVTWLKLQPTHSSSCSWASLSAQMPGHPPGDPTYVSAVPQTTIQPLPQDHLVRGWPQPGLHKFLSWDCPTSHLISDCLFVFVFVFAFQSVLLFVSPLTYITNSISGGEVSQPSQGS